MFYVIYPEPGKFSIKMKIVEIASWEAAAPLWFWKICGGGIKILDFVPKIQKLWKLRRILKIMSYNF